MFTIFGEESMKIINGYWNSVSLPEIGIIVRHVNQSSKSFLVKPLVSEDLCGQVSEFQVGGRLCLNAFNEETALA